MVVPVAPVQDRVRELTGTRAEHVWLSAGSAWHIFDDHAERGPDRRGHRGRGGSDPDRQDQASETDEQVPGVRRQAGGRKWRVAAKFLDEEAYLTSVTPKSEAP